MVRIWNYAHYCCSAQSSAATNSYLVGACPTDTRLLVGNQIQMWTADKLQPEGQPLFACKVAFIIFFYFGVNENIVRSYWKLLKYINKIKIFCDFDLVQPVGRLKKLFYIFLYEKNVLYFPIRKKYYFWRNYWTTPKILKCKLTWIICVRFCWQRPVLRTSTGIGLHQASSTCSQLWNWPPKAPQMHCSISPCAKNSVSQILFAFLNNSEPVIIKVLLQKNMLDDYKQFRGKKC